METGQPPYGPDVLEVLNWPEEVIAQRGTRWLVKLVHAGPKLAVLSIAS